MISFTLLIGKKIFWTEEDFGGGAAVCWTQEGQLYLWSESWVDVLCLAECDVLLFCFSCSFSCCFVYSNCMSCCSRNRSFCCFFWSISIMYYITVTLTPKLPQLELASDVNWTSFASNYLHVLFIKIRFVPDLVYFSRCSLFLTRMHSLCTDSLLKINWVDWNKKRGGVTNEGLCLYMWSFVFCCFWQSKYRGISWKK